MVRIAFKIIIRCSMHGDPLEADRSFSEDIASQALHDLLRKIFCSTRADVVIQHQNQDLLFGEEKVRL